MKQFKGTPGPWAVLPEEVDKHYIRIRGTRLGDRFKIANILTPFYEGVHEREAEETRANAQLIAAAPELLEALQWLTMALSEGSSMDICIGEEKAREVIAKALGEQ